MAKTKTRASNLPVPQSDEDAAAAIAHIGELNRTVARIKADADDRIAAITRDAGERSAPLKEACTAAIEGLRIYCEAHRARLTRDDKTKTAKFATGEIAWRLRPRKVTLPRTKEGIAELIGRLKKLRLKRFIRVKEEVDKDAMRDEHEVAGAVPGVSIGSAGEDFTVEPLEMASDAIPHDRGTAEAEATS